MELNSNLPKIWLIQCLVEGINENLDLLNNLIPPSKEVVDTSRLVGLADHLELQEEYVELMRHRTHSQSRAKKKAERKRLDEILTTLHAVDRKLNEDRTEDKKYLNRLSRKTKKERMRIQDVIRQTINDLELQQQNMRIGAENKLFHETESLYEKTTKELTKVQNEIEAQRRNLAEIETKRETENENSQKQIQTLKKDITQSTNYLEVEQPIIIERQRAKLLSAKRQLKAEAVCMWETINELRRKTERQQEAYKKTQNFIKSNTKLLQADTAFYKEKLKVEVPAMEQARDEAIVRQKKAREELEHYKNEFEKEKQWIVDRKRANEEAERLERATNEAAVVIQKNWRGYSARKKLRAEKGSKKGKKGKKGGKKKGKKKK